MPRNEEGEFELILGNRQLLSVFFLVVFLLGVFFAMGYIVGRNSAPVATAEVTTPVRQEPKPIVVEADPRPTAPPATEPEPAAPVTTAAQQPEPVKEEPAKAPEKPTKSKEVPAKETSSKETKADRKDSVKVGKAEPASRSAAGEPSAGQTYLQLSATQKAEAEVMVDVLRKKGFKAIASQVPDKPGLYRVLVGPAGDNLNKLRADLQSAGFPGDKAIRKNF